MAVNTAQKNEVFRNRFDHIKWTKLRIWSHLLKKSVMENFIFCAVEDVWGTVRDGGGMGRLLVGFGDGSAEFNGAGSNGFANGDKVDSMLAFGLKV